MLLTSVNDIILFRLLGTPMYDIVAAELQANPEVNLEEYITQPNSFSFNTSISDALREWDNKANELDDPVIALINETPEQRAYRYKMDAIVWESPKYMHRQAVKARNKLIKQAEEAANKVFKEKYKTTRKKVKNSLETKPNKSNDTSGVSGGTQTNLPF